MIGCWEGIAEASRRNGSRICVGLDVDLSRLPEPVKSHTDPIFSFNRAVIDATLDLVCCYKPNIAFYEALGLAGLEALYRTIKYIDHRVPIILDAKRGDIGNTALQYARAAFERLGADAVTVNPYLGLDSIAPFMSFAGKGIFVLCLTSNESANDFQLYPEAAPLCERIAARVAEWDRGHGCLGLVVGATHPGKIGGLRKIAGRLPFLLPGIGAQGGSLDEVKEAEVPGGGLGVIVNASRSIIFAGEGKNFADKVRAAAEDLRIRVGVKESTD